MTTLLEAYVNTKKSNSKRVICDRYNHRPFGRCRKVARTAMRLQYDNGQGYQIALRCDKHAQELRETASHPQATFCVSHEIQV